MSKHGPTPIGEPHQSDHDWGSGEEIVADEFGNVDHPLLSPEADGGGTPQEAPPPVPQVSVEQLFAASKIKVSPPSGRGPAAQRLTNPHTQGGRSS